MDSIEKQFDKGVDAINTMVYQNQLQGLIALVENLFLLRFHLKKSISTSQVS